MGRFFGGCRVRGPGTGSLKFNFSSSRGLGFRGLGFRVWGFRV